MEIKNAVINVMNREINSAVFSQKELDGRDQIVQEYIEKLVKKFLNSECLTLDLAASEPAQYLVGQSEDFIEVAEKLTQFYFEAIKTWEEIPEGDLLFFRAEDGYGKTYTGMVKLDFSAKYIHLIDYDDDNLVTNKISQNKTILPNPGQGVSCGIIVKD
ncbi:nucleoid-associated protein [Ligilactobacillus agilis]|uniref:nucleoid-associated protein n=1 Tax=Ligilactobacillus agilis TaxID=1601 RepID=UPI000704D25B|nr:nucleoid-associated protein [Ligilactobacillus agilis]